MVKQIWGNKGKPPFSFKSTDAHYIQYNLDIYHIQMKKRTKIIIH